MEQGTLDSTPPRELSVAEVERKLERGETFVLNVIVDWCPDCTERQPPNLEGFIRRVNQLGLPFHQVTVQRERRLFLSARHERLTERFGGHGYPRTVLVVDGNPVESQVEATSAEELAELADAFAGHLPRPTIHFTNSENSPGD